MKFRRIRHFYRPIVRERAAPYRLTPVSILRVTTRSGILARPLESSRAIAYVDEWLAQPVSLVLSPGEQHWPVLSNLLLSSGTLGNLTSDAHLAAMALENGATLYSSDCDFRRFPGIRHVNPLE